MIFVEVEVVRKGLIGVIRLIRGIKVVLVEEVVRIECSGEFILYIWSCK